ncbi:hypothetical protein FBZ93_111242 [Bradyrhizobium macuxiense]|uniref:Uncharacterized protein n=1 Tax=Bradyrhizobium macuxiense TaxID=1755647 RepID=A0A560LCF3_9BRAD|nr:hypothetical protein FBZ93_111242 [Bradyrhizobium macuxiense]
MLIANSGRWRARQWILGKHLKDVADPIEQAICRGDIV